MDSPVTAPPDAGVSPLAIGDPGRAAREVPAGAPGIHVGHADIELSAASLGGSLIHAATVRGLQHRAAGEPRQDAFALGCLRDSAGGDWLIAVVCDGVGGLGRSHEAAQLASRRLVSLRADGLAWPDAFAWVNEEIRSLDERARMSGAGGADGMATTAMAVTVRREEGFWVGEAAWVGDSPLWHLRPGGDWALVAGPAGDEDGSGSAFYSTRITNPLPTADGSWQVQRFHVGGGALFLMSDGVGNPLKWNERVQETLAEWWRDPPGPFAFGAQVGFARKTHIDDRTVVGIWPADAASDWSVAPPASAATPSDHGAAGLGQTHSPGEAAGHLSGDWP